MGKENKYWLYEGNILRAAAPTKKGVAMYMKPGRIIVKKPFKGTIGWDI
jgi:hypothetical protein